MREEEFEERAAAARLKFLTEEIVRMPTELQERILTPFVEAEPQAFDGEEVDLRLLSEQSLDALERVVRRESTPLPAVPPQRRGPGRPRRVEGEQLPLAAPRKTFRRPRTREEYQALARDLRQQRDRLVRATRELQDELRRMAGRVTPREFHQVQSFERREYSLSPVDIRRQLEEELAREETGTSTVSSSEDEEPEVKRGRPGAQVRETLPPSSAPERGIYTIEQALAFCRAYKRVRDLPAAQSFLSFLQRRGLVNVEKLRAYKFGDVCDGFEKWAAARVSK